MDDGKQHRTFVISQNKYILIIVVFVLFVAFSMAHYSGRPKSQIVIIAFSSLVGYMIYDVSYTESEDHRLITMQFAELEKGNLQQTGMMLKNQVGVSETPKQFAHVRRREEVMRVINKLQPYKIFDMGAITTAMTLIERFFEMYDGLMTGKSTCDVVYKSMQDIRVEIMNTVSALEFNVPPEDVSELVLLGRQLQAKTAHFMKIASRKCEAEAIPNGTYAFGHPSGLDKTKMNNEMY
jgi:hypothetical protein